MSTVSFPRTYGSDLQPKVFIVVDRNQYVQSTVILRVFSNQKSAMEYGESMVESGAIEEFDVYERELYFNNGVSYA